MEVRQDISEIFPGIRTYSWVDLSNEQHGVETTFNPNGSIQVVAHNLYYDYGSVENIRIKDKKYYLKSGNAYTWYPSGQLRGHSRLIDENVGELRLEWYENGQLKSKGYYLNKKLNGLFQFWYENGMLKRQANYRRAIKEGLSQEWYENGQLRCEYIYENRCIKVGSYKKYNEDGSEAVDE